GCSDRLPNHSASLPRLLWPVNAAFKQFETVYARWTVFKIFEMTVSFHSVGIYTGFAEMKPATSIEKVCRIFHAFRSRSAMGITEVAEKTNLLCSDVHRIMRSLQHFGFVAQNPRTKKYELGLELLKLGHLVHERTQLCEVARPFMRLLSESALATANLAVFD